MKPVKFKHITLRGPVNITMEWPENAAAWYYRFKVKGQPREYKSTHERDINKAREKAKLAADDATTAKVAAAPCMLKARIAEYIGMHPNNRQLAVRLNRLREHFKDDIDLANVGEERMTNLIAAFLSTREPLIQPLTLRNERVQLSGFFAWLMRPNAAGVRVVSWRVNPAHATLHKRVKVPKKIKPMVSPEELERLLEASRKTTLHPALILMLSGCRPVGMSRVDDWAKIDLGAHPHVTTFEKNNHVKRALSGWAANELREWKARNPDKPVLPGDEATVRGQLGMLRQLVGLGEHCTFGALRRTCDFKLYQEGVDPQIAAKIMDHSVETAMRNYVEYRQLDPKGSVNVLDFSGKKSEKVSEFRAAKRKRTMKKTRK